MNRLVLFVLSMYNMRCECGRDSYFFEHREVDGKDICPNCKRIQDCKCYLLEKCKSCECYTLKERVQSDGYISGTYCTNKQCPAYDGN